MSIACTPRELSYCSICSPSAIFGAPLLTPIKGRKPVIVTSAILTGAASVAFGFSTTFTMAVILRFFVGFLNGKTVIRSVFSLSLSLSLSRQSPLPSVYLLWTLLIVILIFVRLSGTICYGALFLFINNSVTFDKLGAGTTLTALFRYGWKGIDTYGSIQKTKQFCELHM